MLIGQLASNHVLYGLITIQTTFNMVVGNDCNVRPFSYIYRSRKALVVLIFEMSNNGNKNVAFFVGLFRKIFYRKILQI